MPSRIVPSVLALVSVLALGCDDGVVGPPPPVHPPPSFYHAPPDPVGLISYWKFNDADGTTAADAVGTHHGTLVNGPEWTAGQVGGALRFDGLDDYVDAGGLMAYGPNREETFRRIPVYVDKILKGAKPGDLPVELPMRFEFVVNLKTAKQIGLTIPPNVLARADKVIK